MYEPAARGHRCPGSDCQSVCTGSCPSRRIGSDTFETASEQFTKVKRISKTGTLFNKPLLNKAKLPKQKVSMAVRQHHSHQKDTITFGKQFRKIAIVPAVGNKIIFQEFTIL